MFYLYLVYLDLQSGFGFILLFQLVRIAIAIAMCLRINGMSQWIMWEVSSLFENIGVVQDGNENDGQTTRSR